MYQRLVIFYLTGTGNALVAARWFAEAAKQRGIPAEIISIDRFTNPIEVPHGKGTLVGFIYPTHGFSLPWYMLKFMCAFRGGHRDVFFINTFGGSKIGKFHLPGLSGLALILPGLLFFLRGYRVRGLSSLGLPSNWISIHPGFTASAVSSLVDYCRKRAAKAAADILSGGSTFRGIWSLPFDLAVIPLALGYTLVGRFWLAKTYMATLKCDGCGLCANRCPMNALRMQNGRPFWTFHCESCMRCMNICPKKAIQVSYVFTFASAYVLYGLLFPLALLLVVRVIPSVGASRVPFGGLFRAWIILGVMFLLYRLVQKAARFGSINKVFAGFSFTSLRVWRRYLAPGITAQDFKAPHPNGGAGQEQRHPEA